MSYKKFENQDPLTMPTIERIENFITNYLWVFHVGSLDYVFLREDKTKTLLKMNEIIPDETLKTVLDYATQLFPRMVIYPLNKFEIELRGY